MDNMWQQDWVSKWALYSPEKTAIKEYETGKTISYSQLNEQANNYSHWLTKKYGLKSGSRIAVLSDYNIECIILFCTAQKTGFTLVPLNYRLVATEISHILEESKPELVIFEEKYRHLLKDVSSGIFFTIEELVNVKHYNDPFPVMEVDENHPIFILYTAGTTGLPKGVLYTHKMLFWNSINTAISLIVNTESRSINVMPPFHTGGWNVLLTPFLHHGGYTVLFRKFDPAAVLKFLQEEDITIFMGVPTMLQMMANLPEFDEARFPSLYYIIVGGEPMSIPLIEKWSSHGVAVRQGYGMTEVGPNLTSLHQSDSIRKKGSIGRPNFYVQIKVVDEHGAEVQRGESGELWLRGPMVTPGYLNNPDGTTAAFSPDGKWFKTGDIIRVDEENYIYVVDRVKNMYISGGENVYPAEVERVLIQHPAVNECVIIAVKHEKWGETGKACVSLTEGNTVTEQELIDYCAQRLAKFKVPKSVVFLEEIPKTDAGKFDRKKLKSIYS